MKKFFQSKGFIVTSLAVLCVAILGVCWFASRDRTEDFKPEESPPSSTTSDWSDGGTQTDGESGAGAYTPGQSSSPEEEYPNLDWPSQSCGGLSILRRTECDVFEATSRPPVQPCPGILFAPFHRVCRGR